MRYRSCLPYEQQPKGNMRILPLLFASTCTFLPFQPPNLFRGEDGWTCTLQGDQNTAAADLLVMQERANRMGIDATFALLAPNKLALTARQANPISVMEVFRNPYRFEARGVEQPRTPGSILMGYKSTPSTVEELWLGDVVLNQTHLQDVQFEQSDLRNSAHFSFDSTGEAILTSYTTTHIHKRLALVVDGNVWSAPFIQTPIIGGRMELTDDYERMATNDLQRAQLRIGLLSGRLESTYTVGNIEWLEPSPKK